MTARIMLTHRVSQRIQALVQGGAIDRVDIGPHRGPARAARIDLHKPVLRQIRGHPLPVRIDFGDPLIDPIP